MSSSGDIQRAKGQVDEDIECFEGVFLVLCGQTPRQIVKDLKAYANKKASFLSGSRVEVIVRGRIA